MSVTALPFASVATISKATTSPRRVCAEAGLTEIDVTGLLGDAWFDHVGNYSTGQLHVVERYTMMSPNHIEYEATLEDPNVYSEPWTIRLPLYRRIEQNAKLLEFKCVEFSEEKLYGHLRRVEDEED